MMDWGPVWRLPGPAGFVRDLATSVISGRHTMALLPAWLCTEELTDSLVDAVAVELAAQIRGSRMRRLRPGEADGTLAYALGRDATWEIETIPTTLEELLTHEELAGNAYSLVCGDLQARHGSELPGFIRRLAQGSRPLSTHDRMTLLVIGSHEQILLDGQQDISDVAISVVWFWNRLARWDLAALLAAQSGTERMSGLLYEIRLEAVIEVARWNVPLALDLWSHWSGDVGDLRSHLATEAAGEAPPTPPRSSPGTHPPTTWLAHWDAGTAEGWHGTLAVHPSAEVGLARDPHRWIWLAQARVLLPWIEAKRIKVYARVRDTLGSQFRDVLEDGKLWTVADGPVEDAILEMKDLAWLIRNHLANEKELKRAANSLWEARNAIAHLRPLSTPWLEDMAEACAFLG